MKIPVGDTREPMATERMQESMATFGVEVFRWRF